MRICLLNAPGGPGINRSMESTYPPCGLLSIAAAAEKAEHQVYFKDAIAERLTADEVSLWIYKLNPDCVGLSCLSVNSKGAFEVARLVKKRNGNVLTVLGGVHATFLDVDILRRVPEIDVVVRGEGERTFVELLAESKDLPNMNGITYRRKEDIVRNESRNTIQDIDALPMPAYHLANMPIYFKQARLFGRHMFHPASLLMSARGCNGNCKFCISKGMWGRLRCHSPCYIVDHLEVLNKRWGVRDFFIYDDSFPPSKEWLEGFRRELKAKQFQIYYKCLSRIKGMDEDTLSLMKETGCYLVHYGVESGSDAILKNINKGINRREIERVISLTRKMGIFVGVFIMVGLPGEGVSEMYETLKFTIDLRPDEVACTPTTIYPGSDLSLEAKLPADVWFEPSGLYAENKTKKVLPWLRLTDDEIKNICIYILHQVHLACFWNRLRLYMRTSPLPRITIMWNMLRFLGEESANVIGNPFAQFGARQYIIWDRLLYAIWVIPLVFKHIQAGLMRLMKYISTSFL